MLYDRASKLEFYSLAVVLFDKPAETYEITVTPMEELNLLDGDLATWLVKYDIALPDVNGETKSSHVKMEAKLIATWLPLDRDGNKKSAPDVIRNETVLILRYGDSDIYYWTTMFYEPHIRRLEHSIYTWGNKGTPLITYNEHSSYWMKVSTREKYIWLHTTYDDGVGTIPTGYPGSEKAMYDIKLDTFNGELTIVDDHDNWIKLFSVERKIDIKTGVVNIDAPQVNMSGSLHVGGELKVAGVIGTGGGLNSPWCCCTCPDAPSFPRNDFSQVAEIIFK